jgi:hypothetical protein
VSKNFQAGRLQYFASEWEKITKDPVILDIVKHCHIQFINGTAPTQKLFSQPKFNEKQSLIIDQEIDKLLKLKVLSLALWDDQQFLSPIFLRLKKNNEYRMILNLKKFNENVQYHHFKMDTFETALTLIRKDMYLCTSDIRHAYYSIPVAYEHKRYFRFQWRGKIFEFNAVPNGYRDGPRIFTKLLKPVFAKLRADGHICTGFIDDSLLGGATYDECYNTACVSHDLLQKLGFLMNDEKSDIIPSQKVTYLGFIIDSVQMIVLLSQDKKANIVDICSKLSHAKIVTIRELAQVIGVLVSSFPAVDYGKLFYRNLEKAKIKALKENCGNYESVIKVSPGMRDDLEWWFSNIHSQVRVIDRGTPSEEIQTDSSLIGWGAVFHGNSFGGRWTLEEKLNHINVLELMAIFFALKALVDKVRNTHVKILSDSSTAVCYINNMGGIRSDKCNEVSRDIWLFCMSEGIWLSCAHIPGVKNEADIPSRQFKDHIEWEIKDEIFEKICKIWQKPDIDLFASRLNNKLPIYCSWKPDPYATYIDAFTLDWGILKCLYIFPPFSVVSRCIRKIQTDRAKAVIIAPLWPTQAWFSLLMKILVDLPVILPRTTRLLRTMNQDQKHPMSQKLVLMACKVSGVYTEHRVFLEKQPILSCHHGVAPQNASTKCIFRDGYSSVIDKRLIPFRFLSKM